MWGSKTKARAALIALFALVFMTVGATAALALRDDALLITAESTGCETVTIFYQGPWDYANDGFYDFPYNSQGTVNGVVRNGNGVGSSQIVFTNVAPGLANWSGSMWWTWGYEVDNLESQQQGQYFDQGTVQVEPCPVTTTTQPTVTTQPDTSSSTIAQVETDLPDGAGPGFGLTAALAAIGISLLGGAALVASPPRELTSNRANNPNTTQGPGSRNRLRSFLFRFASTGFFPVSLRTRLALDV